MTRRTGRTLVAAGSVLAALGSAHAWWNLQQLRQLPSVPSLPDADPGTVGRDSPRLSVLIPARDEAARIGHCLHSVRAQQGVDFEVLVLDDRSSDGTAQVVEHHLEDSRIQLLTSDGEPPAGWLGKQWACHQLAHAASGDLLVFVDADVQLRPDALARLVEAFESEPLDAVSPYPRQVSVTLAERVVQPLLQWSWATLLPLASAERSSNPALVAANGQVLAITREAYDAIGGHEAVRERTLDDVALFQELTRRGRRAVLTDGTDVATCRMYDDWPSLRDGYSKSLWEATGSPAGAVAVTALLGLTYLVPPLAAVRRGSTVGAAGYAAAVVGRAVVAHRVGGRVWPDSLLHPASIAAFTYLVGRSWVGRYRGTLTWKSRTL